MYSLLTALFLNSAVYAQEITAHEILERMDQNMVFDTRSSTTTMTVIRGSRVKTYQLISHGRGENQAAIEFLAPQRDRGTKMLKIDGELWMYTPDIERVSRISGHMLRQGMMSSDFSYEDLMETNHLTELYTATLAGEELLGDVPTYRLELTSNEEDVAYPRRVMWIEQEHWIPIKQELYAGSGRLVKVWAMGAIQEFDGRWYPTAMRMDDAVESGSYTIVQFEDLRFSVELEDEIFERRWLER